MVANAGTMETLWGLPRAGALAPAGTLAPAWVLVPRRCHVELRTRDGGITVGNLTGNVRARSVQGNVFIRRIEGSVDAGTVGGDVIVSRCSGAVVTSGGPSSIALRARRSAGWTSAPSRCDRTSPCSGSSPSICP